MGVYTYTYIYIHMFFKARYEDQPPSLPVRQGWRSRRGSGGTAGYSVPSCPKARASAAIPDAWSKAAAHVL